MLIICLGFVYLGVNFKLDLKLCVDYTLRCRKFLVAVCGVLRSKVAGYEDIFANILVKKCLPILDYSLDLSKSWNTDFRWLFSYCRFESTRLLFHTNRIVSMRYLIDTTIMCFVIGCMSSDRMLLRGLAKYVMFNGKINNGFCKHNVTVYHNAQGIQEFVNFNFLNYCNECLQ